MRKLILFSGGMDSSLLLASAQWSGDTPIPLFIDYGQPHLDRELAAARSQVGDALMMRSVALDGGIVARAASPVVPGRNAVLLAVAVNVAESLSVETVEIGCCAADAALFADCRPAFIDAFNAMLAAQASSVRVSAPLLHSTKREIRDRLGRLLSKTWSCYFPTDAGACGNCGACRARGE
jgi:7-cyano-7-deazaguanine synthase